MQFIGYLLFLAMLLGVAIANSFNTTISNNLGLLPRVDPVLDPAFTTPDYTRPALLFMPGGSGPMFRSGWDNDCPRRDRAQQAFFAVGVRAKACTRYLRAFRKGSNDGTLFTRYFPKEASKIVLDTISATFFNVMLDNNRNLKAVRPPMPAQESNFPWTPWNEGMQLIDIRCDSFPLGTQGGTFDLICRDPLHPTLQGQMFLGDNFAPSMPDRRALMILCRYAFLYPDLPSKNDKSKCGILNDPPYQTVNQFVLPAVLFHEFLHDVHLHDSYTVPAMKDDPIVDFDIFMMSVFRVDTTNYPPNGYGPWNAMMLRKATANDPNPDVLNQPLYNADSYTMFALDAFWSDLCEVMFTDPPSFQASIVGWLPPEPLNAPPLPPPGSQIRPPTPPEY